jgi:exonuclease SbcC
MKTRILRIRVRNLASLEGEHVVELEHGPLADAGIFPIVGPTGAGKSTLLDAICLALFARLPRLPAATKGARSDEGLSPSDPRHALRRGAGEGLAEVEFLGRDGRRYRATWSVQRAHKRPDRPLQNAKHVFFDVARDRAVGDGKSETKSLIEARLGLGYEELVRSLDTRRRERDLACERLLGGLESSRVELRDAEERARAAHAKLERELGRPLHDALEAELRSAVESRRAQRERLLGIEKRSAELQSQVEQERVRLRDAREREAKLVEAIERARGEMTTRRDERASLLEGRPAEAVEAELERARDEATNAHEQAAQRAAAAQARHAADRETLDVRIAEACDAEREANDAHERWNQAIRDAELDADTVVAALVAWPSDRVASARRELDRTHDRLTRATTLHERASRSLAEHRADCPADLVEQAERRIYCDQAATRAAEVYGQYAGELAADDTRRHRSAALLSEREIAVARLDLLEQLVALVGSGQGASNHLSRFAQGLTLEVLVDAANTQLERLAPRSASVGWRRPSSTSSSSIATWRTSRAPCTD